MRVTNRCLALMRLLKSARWLSTGQVHRRFFSHAKLNAASKRLCKLKNGKYLLKAQPHQMQQARFTLGREGKRILETAGIGGITLEKHPPQQWEHFKAINDIRIEAELSNQLSYFFAYWELRKVGWSHALIPDAVFSIGDRTFAVEFDRGEEGIKFFVRSKMTVYLQQGLDGLNFSAVIIVTDREARMRSLANAIGEGGDGVLYSTIDEVRQRGILAPIFSRGSGKEGMTLV